MKTNSNIYQVVYAAVMVLVVGTVLAFIYMALKPQQDENIANDKRKQILAAVGINATDADVKQQFEQFIVGERLVDTEGNVTDSAAGCAFDVEMKSNVKLPDVERKLPVYVCKLADGSAKYLLPVYGAGLWGPIWGYVSVNSDGSTIFGTNFSHESETPGLGARIEEESFRATFQNKQLYKDGEYKGVEVVKKGQKPTTDGADYVDAISGATITSRGVSDMLQNCLGYYQGFFKRLSSPAN